MYANTNVLDGGAYSNQPTAPPAPPSTIPYSSEPASTPQYYGGGNQPQQQHYQPLPPPGPGQYQQAPVRPQHQQYGQYAVPAPLPADYQQQYQAPYPPQGPPPGPPTGYYAAQNQSYASAPLVQQQQPQYDRIPYEQEARRGGYEARGGYQQDYDHYAQPLQQVQPRYRDERYQERRYEAPVQPSQLQRQPLDLRNEMDWSRPEEYEYPPQQPCGRAVEPIYTQPRGRSRSRGPPQQLQKQQDWKQQQQGGAAARSLSRPARRSDEFNDRGFRRQEERRREEESFRETVGMMDGMQLHPPQGGAGDADEQQQYRLSLLLPSVSAAPEQRRDNPVAAAAAPPAARRAVNFKDAKAAAAREQRQYDSDEEVQQINRGGGGGGRDFVLNGESLREVFAASRATPGEHRPESDYWGMASVGNRSGDTWLRAAIMTIAHNFSTVPPDEKNVKMLTVEHLTKLLISHDTLREVDQGYGPYDPINGVFGNRSQITWLDFLREMRDAGLLRLHKVTVCEPHEFAIYAHFDKYIAPMANREPFTD